MRRNFLILIFLVLGSALSTISAHVASNVQVRQVGKTIVITYDLDEPSLVDLRMSFDPTTGSSKSKLVQKLYSTKAGDYKSPNISGDVGVVSAGKGKKIVWDVLEDYDPFIRTNVQFYVDAQSPYSGMKTFVLGEYGYGFTPQHSGGLMVGQVYKYAGWYASFRSNFNFQSPTTGLSCSENGTVNLVDVLYHPFYTGQVKNTHYMVNVGLTVDLTGNHWDDSMLALYVGAGYGCRYQMWQTTEDQWIRYYPTTYKNYSVEAGLIGSIKGFTISAGVSTIGFKYLEATVGIGWTFPSKVKL